MFGNKRSISVLASKAGSWLINFRQISQEKWQTNQNHISQCKIAKNLGLSPNNIHNIVKRFRESREITVHVGQGRKPQLNVLDLWALKWHCIRKKQSHGLRSTSENHCHLTQPAAASRTAAWISVTLGESYTSILCTVLPAGFSVPELISDSQKDS